MYQEYFGFSEMPFNITPDPKFLYLSPTHQEAFSHLRYGIEQRKGFIVLTGEVGCGKTTLCRALLNELDPKLYDTALILNPRVQCNQLLRDILKELGEPIPLDTQLDLVERLHTALLRRVHAGKAIVMIIDEAQVLSYEVLEQVRLLSNLETDTQKLLQVVLMGQPELKEKLKHPQLRQLRQRILIHYDLKPLTFQDTCSYIQHRIGKSHQGGRPNFSYWALRKIHRQSRGIPRIINNLCDKSLLSAYVRMDDKISHKDVKVAIKDIELN